MLSRLGTSATKRLRWVQRGGLQPAGAFRPIMVPAHPLVSGRGRLSAGGLRVNTSRVCRKLEPSPPLLLPCKTSSGHRLVRDLHPARARAREPAQCKDRACAGWALAPLASRAGTGRCGSRPLWEATLLPLGTTPSLPLLKNRRPRS